MSRPLMKRVKRGLWRLLSVRRDPVRQATWQGQPRMEALEQRMMLSSTLLGVDPEYPRISYDSGGTMSYDAASQLFEASATPFAFRNSLSDPLRIIQAPRGLSLSIQVDNAGQLVGGVPGDDLVVSGSIDADGNGSIDYSGVLLTGEIVAFGALDAGTTDQYEFIFTPTGGALVDAGIYDGKNIAVVMNSLNSGFADEFTVDFSGSSEGVLGPIDRPMEFHPGIDIEKYVKPFEAPKDCDFEGKTPGYWKQSHHFDDWVGYDPGDSYNDVFGVNDPDDPTLLEALKRGGGGREALGRHAVAALLNAAHPNIHYFYTTAQIIAAVQAAYASNNYGVKDDLEDQNELEANLQDSPCEETDPMSGGLGEDADDPTGPVVEVGSMVMFTYVVTNTGDVELADVVVTDDNATPDDASDDFNPMAIEEGGFNVGDLDQDGRLDVDEQWLYVAMAEVTEGQHVNVSVVVGTPVDEDGNRVGDDVTDSDPAHWLGQGDVPPPPPPGDVDGLEGLTPGFWKQPHHFQYWTGFNPGDSYEAVFGVDVPGAEPTLLEALSSGGGGVSALLRHSVAALLNAANSDVEYAYNVEQVIALVQSAFSNGSFDSTKDEFEEENERGGADLKGETSDDGDSDDGGHRNRTSKGRK